MIEAQLDRIEALLLKILKEVSQMPATQAQLDSAIQALGALITAASTEGATIVSSVAAAVTSMNAAVAKLAAAGVSVDLTAELDAINSMASTVQASVANVTTAQQSLDAAEATLKPAAGA
jgi:prefoldin subunit 5